MKRLQQPEAAFPKPKGVKGTPEKLQEMLDRELIEGAKEKDPFVSLAKVTAALDSGASIDARDQEGMTALMHASRNRNDHAGVALVSRGADGSKKDKRGRDALAHLEKAEREASDAAEDVYPPRGSILKAVLKSGIENFNPAWFA